MLKNEKNKFLKVSIVAGGAGFIGSNLCTRLLEEGRKVVVVDSLVRGDFKNLSEISSSLSLYCIEADLSDRMAAANAFAEAFTFGVVDEVWHLAANSDISAGVEDSDVDLKNTFLTTVEILNAMKFNGIRKLYFASSSAIYGDHADHPIHENIGPLLPISNYGAMKLASEGLISAAVESFLEKVCLFRFPNVVGVPATHGVILDFINKLKKTKVKLEVLGDGTQHKAYLHVSDLLDAMLFIRSYEKSEKITAINIGPVDTGVSVSWIAEMVVKCIAPSATINFGFGNKGWVGDVPQFFYSTSKIQALGWQPALGSKEAIIRAIEEIAIQEGLTYDMS
jgi:UDP-glucose 4-epimerase